MVRLRKVSPRLIAKVIQQIVKGTHTQKVILFGSYAYGQPGPHSDVDLLIIMESRRRPAERAVQIARLLQFYPFSMDIFVRTPAEIRKRLQMGDPFYREIMQRGKILYDHKVV